MLVYKLQAAVDTPGGCDLVPQFYVPGKMLFGKNEFDGDLYFTEDPETLKAAQEIVDLKGEPRNGRKYIGKFEMAPGIIDKFVSDGSTFNKLEAILNSNLNELRKFKTN